MNSFNAMTSAVFDLLLAPWGHGLPWLDILVWSAIAGVGALFIYKKISNQEGIARAKDGVKMHLMEIRLWRHDLRIVARATRDTLGKNALYLGHNLLPMVVLLVPMMVLLFQLVAHFAYTPAPVGSEELLRVVLHPEARERATDIQLELPPGVVTTAPPVRTPDGEAYWRLRAEQAGDHRLELSVGGHTLAKTWAVGGEPRKVPVKRTRSWEGFLYPGEAGIPSDSPFHSVAMDVPARVLPLVPDGEIGVLVAFLVLSLAFGFGLKDLLGVTL
jgi:hypothetical protein